MTVPIDRLLTEDSPLPYALLRDELAAPNPAPPGDPACPRRRARKVLERLHLRPVTDREIDAHLHLERIEAML